MNFTLRPPIESDLDVFFANQLDEEANFMAAFTPENRQDKEAYFVKWKRLWKDESVHFKTIASGETVLGLVSKFVMHGDNELTYAIGKEFWGNGIASRALQEFLLLELARPIYGRVAFDNIASARVLEKAGFVKIGKDKGFANARGMEIEEFIYRLD